MAQEYIYQPLSHNGHARLLLIENGDSTPFHCTLTEFSLIDHPPSYTALSYTWKKPISDVDDESDALHHSIYIDGKLLRISKNLQDALSYLSRTKHLRLWIDAISINQNDTDERSKQVELMRTIFSHAAKVVIWLGPKANCSEKAMDFLKELANKGSSGDLDRINWLVSVAEDPAHFERWRALRDFLSRSWWKRAWVIQEFVMAQDVDFACGEQHLQEEQMADANQLLFDGWFKVFLCDTMAKLRINARTLDPMRNLFELRRRIRNCEDIGLLPCLAFTRLTLATDTRDYLFAKFGMLGKQAATIYRPNYRRQPDDVFKDFAQSYIEVERDLYIICYAGMRPPRVTTLPSWLPDWGMAKPQYPYRCSWSGNSSDWPVYKAHGNSHPVVEFLDDRNVLRAKGVIFDRIDGVQYDPYPPETRPGVQPKNTACAYSTLDQVYEAFWRTIVADTDRYDSPSQAPKEFGMLWARKCKEVDEVFEEWKIIPDELPDGQLPAGASNIEKRWYGMRNLKLGGKSLKDIATTFIQNHPEGRRSSLTYVGGRRYSELSNNALWDHFEHSYGQTLYERRVFTTNLGYFGVGSRTLEPGDDIAVFLGCPVPVIIRSKGSQYEVVGETYIHGIMEGEAVEAANAGQGQWTYIDLC